MKKNASSHRPSRTSVQRQVCNGPYPADGFFGAGTHKQFDGCWPCTTTKGSTVQGAELRKRGEFHSGLPIVRTSPDHGTGFDIAGQGIAESDSLRAAIYMARDIRFNRIAYRELTANPLEIAPPKRKERY